MTPLCVTEREQNTHYTPCVSLCTPPLISLPSAHSHTPFISPSLLSHLDVSFARHSSALHSEITLLSHMRAQRGVLSLPSSNLLSLPHIHPALSTSLLSHSPGASELGWLQCVSVTQQAFGSADSTRSGQQTGTGRIPETRPDCPLGGSASVTSRSLTPCFFPSVCLALSLSIVLFTWKSHTFFDFNLMISWSKRK